MRAAEDFNLSGSALVRLHGVGGRTVPILRANDIHVVADFAPEILDIGTNDLSRLPAKVVGSAIVQLLLEDFSVRIVRVCHVIPLSTSCSHALSFLDNASLLNHYVSVVLEDLPNVFCWRHADFNSPYKDLYLMDGVNASGQYLPYRSYRGAVLKAVNLFRHL